MQLHVDEQSLMKGADALRRKRIEEDKKRREEGERHEEREPQEENMEDVIGEVQFLDQVLPRQLDRNYYNLMQLIVRYGERPIEVEGTVYSIGEVIIYTLEGDEIAPPQPVYQTIIDEFKRHSKEPGFKAEQFFKFHPDRAVSALAVDMIADKYQMSAPKEEARLGELVTQLLYEMKLTVINMQIAELEANLKEAQQKNDVDRQMVLLSHHPQLIAQRNEICKRLGNRIINL